MSIIVLISYIAVLLLVGSVLLVKRNKPKIKGYIGERRVHKLLLGLGKEYKIFHDVYVEKRDGKMTQIDHIVLSKYGIFVIETKNYKGWIFGEEEQKNWTQTIYRNRQSFYSPILQNRTHVRALQHFLQVESSLNSVIVFSDAATFKFTADFATAEVIQNAQLKKTIAHYKTVVFSDEQIKTFTAQLNKISNVNKVKKLKIKREHVAQFKQPQVKQKAAGKLCPECDQQLALKRGKYGEFYGCGGYPRCRYTEKVR